MTTTFNFSAVRSFLRCPKSHAELVFTDSALVSCDPATRLRYPIVDGFPVMLMDDAVQLDLSTWSRTMKEFGRDSETGIVNATGITD